MEIENKIGAEQALNGDDEELMLSASTLKALQEFYQRKQTEEDSSVQQTISEDWVCFPIISFKKILKS